MFESTNIFGEKAPIAKAVAQLRSGDSLSFIQDLRAGKIDPNARSYSGEWIHSAIHYKRPSVIIALLQAGATLDINLNQPAYGILHTTDHLLIDNASFTSSSRLNLHYLGPLMMSYGLQIGPVQRYRDEIEKTCLGGKFCSRDKIAHLEKYQKIGSDIHVYRLVVLSCLKNIENLKEQDKGQLTNRSSNPEKTTQEWRDVFINAHLAKSLLLSLQAEQQALLLEKPSEEGSLYVTDYQFRIDQCDKWLADANPSLNEAEQFNLLKSAISKQEQLFDKANKEDNEADKNYYQYLINYLRTNQSTLEHVMDIDLPASDDTDSVPSDSTESSPFAGRIPLFGKPQKVSGLHHRHVTFSHQEFQQ